MSDRVTVSREDHLAIVSLSNPDRLNVLDRGGWEALAFIMTVSGRRPARSLCRDRGFRDPGVFRGLRHPESFPTQRQTPEQVEAYARALEGGLSALWSCPHPTLALIHGVCVGGGLEIAACCDLRICSESSRFGAPINRLGLTMSYTELGPLVALVGASGALEVLLEGGLLDAEQAYQKGFVNRVVSDDEVEDEARATAQRIAAGAPLVNRWHKKFVRRLTGGGGPLTEDERQEAYEAFQTDDYREGVQAFLEGRDPRFEGK